MKQISNDIVFLSLFEKFLETKLKILANWRNQRSHKPSAWQPRSRDFRKGLELEIFKILEKLSFDFECLSDSEHTSKHNDHQSGKHVLRRASYNGRSLQS